MSTEQIVALLIQERDRLNAAIEALEGPKHQDRAPKAFAVAKRKAPVRHAHHVQAAETMRAKKQPWSDAKRKAQGTRMKAYWAAKRKAAEK